MTLVSEDAAHNSLQMSSSIVLIENLPGLICKKIKKKRIVKEWVKALVFAVILEPADLFLSFSFPRYRNLKMPCWSLQISNVKSSSADGLVCWAHLLGQVGLSRHSAVPELN